ncbi:MAG: hypothetical protein VX777_08545 [Chlamydiota bacterium]|nr:hypothetical protein [Chlamydiota bacterium]
MTLTNIPSSSITQVDLAKRVYDGKTQTLESPIKISFASSDNQSLNVFRYLLGNKSNLNHKLKPCIQKYSILKPFDGLITQTVELLTILLDKISSDELADHDKFRCNVLNIVYINKSDDQLPDVFLKTINELKLSNMVYLFERGLSNLDIFKHNTKIFSFTSDPHRFLQNVFWGSKKTHLKLKEIVLNCNNLQSIMKLEWFNLRNAGIPTRTNLSCHTHDVVSDESRRVVVSILKKNMLDKYAKLKSEISETQEYILSVFGENQCEDTLESLCELKARKVDVAIYNEVNGSLKRYKDIYNDMDEISRLYFSTENPKFNLENLLGKRRREEFGFTLIQFARKKSLPNTSSTSITDSYRLECQTLLKNELLKVLEYSHKKIKKLERKIVRLLGKTNSSLTIEKRCEIRAKNIEAGIYDVAKKDSNEYVTMFLHQKINIENSFSSQEISFLEKSKAAFDSMFSTPVLKNVNPAPRYEWFYSGCGFPLFKALQTNKGLQEDLQTDNDLQEDLQEDLQADKDVQEDLQEDKDVQASKEMPYIYKGPVDENGNHILEHLFRHSKKRKIKIKLDGFPIPVVINLDTFEITIEGIVFKALAREVTFLGQQIDVPSFWSEYQDNMIEVEELKLTELPDLELGVKGETVKFVDRVNEEIVKVHPGATVKSVKRIQNFRHLNNFNLKCQSMDLNNDALDDQEAKKNAAIVKQEESSVLAHGSNKINSSETNTDALDDQEPEKEAVVVKHEELYFFFYGSNKTNPSEIISENCGVPLDNNHFNPNKNWGKGIDLSSSFLYADKCSHAYYDPEQKVIVKRVLIVVANLGYSCSANYNPNLRRPHSRGLFNGMPVYYDSLTGRYSSAELNTDVYIVYDSDQVLPAFEIEYTVPFEN